jgi:hypothetical protein
MRNSESHAIGKRRTNPQSTRIRRAPCPRGFIEFADFAKERKELHALKLARAKKCAAAALLQKQGLWCPRRVALGGARGPCPATSAAIRNASKRDDHPSALRGHWGSSRRAGTTAAAAQRRAGAHHHASGADRQVGQCRFFAGFWIRNRRDGSQQCFSTNQPTMRMGGTPSSHANPYFMTISSFGRRALLRD